MTKEFEDFQKKFRLTELLIHKYKYWSWSVRPAQGTLGASILSLNRSAESWSMATAEENAELAMVIKDVEVRCKREFNYDRINYLMLMMFDPQVHFHVFPRYSAPRAFAGLQWLDDAWPKPPDLMGGPSEANYNAIIRDALKN